MIYYNSIYSRPILNSENAKNFRNYFLCKQEDNIQIPECKDGKITWEHLIDILPEDGSIIIRCHQVKTNNELMTDVWHSISELMASGNSGCMKSVNGILVKSIRRTQ